MPPTTGQVTDREITSLQATILQNPVSVGSCHFSRTTTPFRNITTKHLAEDAPTPRLPRPRLYHLHGSVYIAEFYLIPSNSALQTAADTYLPASPLSAPPAMSPDISRASCSGSLSWRTMFDIDGRMFWPQAGSDLGALALARALARARVVATATATASAIARARARARARATMMMMASFRRSSQMHQVPT
ncbi:hypothetical protein B2J93_6651 [Marssonina coronariae]|uniref:Uncharacterized protein n=1 Tax=Diplocarpon coronariae TaxID=2795749 RepID=A0A218ZG59_9HELO|nr:hypothetical protein B2J93_6651 [Marssonina coronariae]